MTPEQLNQARVISMGVAGGILTALLVLALIAFALLILDGAAQALLKAIRREPPTEEPHERNGSSPRRRPMVTEPEAPEPASAESKINYPRPRA